MTYIAILGRQPELGLIELESLGIAAKPFGKETALSETKLAINDLGGVQKAGRVLYQGPALDLNEAPISLDDLPIREGKTTFGLSYYGSGISTKFVMAAGLTLKKRLKGEGSVRLVTPQTGISLSAAQVKFNGLIRNGFELIVAINRGNMVIALTEQIQDIDWYAARDFDRPTRSATVGMLPPKLAQTLVNTTSAPLVYDPFCGTGVILQEALLLNRTAMGSDLSNEMINASKANLTWLGKQRSGLSEWSVKSDNAIKLKLPGKPMAIVSEGYLGPNLSRQPDQVEYAKLRSQTEKLYTESLTNWASQLPSGTEISICVPVWHTNQGWKGTAVVDRLSDLGYTLRSFAAADARNIIYRRPNQIVGRQLLLARKN